MPVTESYLVSVDAGDTTPDILLGKKLSSAPGPGVYKFLGVYETGAGTLVMDLWRAAEQIGDGIPMRAVTGGPNNLEDELTAFSTFGGEKITAKLREIDATPANTVPSIKFTFQSTSG